MENGNLLNMHLQGQTPLLQLNLSVILHPSIWDKSDCDFAQKQVPSLSALSLTAPPCGMQGMVKFTFFWWWRLPYQGRSGEVAAEDKTSALFLCRYPEGIESISCLPRHLLLFLRPGFLLLLGPQNSMWSALPVTC